MVRRVLDIEARDFDKTFLYLKDNDVNQVVVAGLRYLGHNVAEAMAFITTCRNRGINIYVANWEKNVLDANGKLTEFGSFIKGTLREIMRMETIQDEFRFCRKKRIRPRKKIIS